MKPGDEGGSVPLHILFLLRRRRRQHTKTKAIVPRIPNGMPTPSPNFSFLVSPALFVAGESGAVVALTAVVDPDVSIFEENGGLVVESNDEFAKMDSIVELGVTGGTRSCDVLSNAQVGRLVIEGKDTAVLVVGVNGQFQFASGGVTMAVEVVGGEGGHAVSGPNSLIK